MRVLWKPAPRQEWISFEVGSALVARVFYCVGRLLKRDRRMRRSALICGRLYTWELYAVAVYICRRQNGAVLGRLHTGTSGLPASPGALHRVWVIAEAETGCYSRRSSAISSEDLGLNATAAQRC